MSKVVLFFIGLFSGIALMGLIMWHSIPVMLFETSESSLGFEETGQKLEASAKAMGWSVPKSYRLDKSLKKKDLSIRRMQVFSLCKPKLAHSILKDDANKKVSAMMPCRLSVYETNTGKVFISGLNMKIMSTMFSGSVGEAMSKVAHEAEKITHKSTK